MFLKRNSRILVVNIFNKRPARSHCLTPTNIFPASFSNSPNICGLVLTPFDEHALQSPEDDDGQDDALIFVCLELAAQTFCGFPDVAGEVVELRFVERERQEKRVPYS